MPDSGNTNDGPPVLEPGERPTLKTISRLTGLAVATVSRALHDAPDIGQDTKRRVQEMAELVGYRPNRAGVRLRTGKTNVISLVLSTDHDLMNHTARLISSIAGALRSTPYHLIVTPYFPSEDPMIPVRYVVETQSADAVILNQIQPRDPRIAYLMEQQFPFAAHGRTDWSRTHAYFDFDNKRFAEIGVEQLAARGRRNLALLAPPLSQNYAQNMVDGARSKAAELGVALRVFEGITSDDSSTEVQDAMARELQSGDRIDGIITGSATSSMAVTGAAEDIGLTIGTEIDLFSKEAIPFLKRFRPGILAIQEDVATAGEFLARAAIQAIADPSRLPMQGLETPRL